MKRGHLGAAATYQWAEDRGISITMDEACTATVLCTLSTLQQETCTTIGSRTNI